MTEKDTFYDEYIEHFVKKAADNFLRVYNFVAELEDDIPIGIYAAGEHTKALFSLTEIGKKNILYIFDNKKKEMDDYKVVCPTSELLEQCELILVSANGVAKEIAKSLKEDLGYNGKIVIFYEQVPCLSFYEYFPKYTEKERKRLTRYNKIAIIREEALLLVEFDKIRKNLGDVEHITEVVFEGECCGYVDFIINIFGLFHCNIRFHSKTDIFKLIIYKGGQPVATIDMEKFLQLCDCCKESIAMRPERLSKLMENYCYQLEKMSRYSIGYKFYNKKKRDYVNLYPTDKTDYSDVAIVLQGSIKDCADYTCESILQYKESYPGIELVLSTWEDEAEGLQFERICNIDGLGIVLGKKPVQAGVNNVNMQIWSVANGIEYVKNKLPDVKYILKLRADARIYSFDILRLMRTMVEKENSKERKIICTPVSKTVMFDYIDYYNFGDINAMSEFWKKEEIDDNLLKEIGDGEENVSGKLLYGRYANKRDMRQVYLFIPLCLLDFEWNKYSFHNNCEYRSEALRQGTKHQKNVQASFLDMLEWNDWI